MKRKLFILLTLVLTFISLSGIGQAQGVSLKATAAYGTMEIGDYNTLLDGAHNIFTLVSAQTGYSVEGFTEKSTYGFDFESELIINFSRFFGIGFGGGYINRYGSNDTWLEGPFALASYHFSHEITAIPAKASAYIFLPVSSYLNIYLSGGVGYYLGKTNYDYTLEVYDPVTGMRTDGFGEAECKDFGYHGGIGIQFSVIPNVSFFIEDYGRFCKLKNWEGDESLIIDPDNPINRSGTMWFFDETIQNLGSRPFVSIGEQPSGPYYQNVRKFEVDLSGYSIHAGIILRFKFLKL